MLCNALQFFAMLCNALQCLAMPCNALQCLAMPCNALQCCARESLVLQETCACLMHVAARELECTVQTSGNHALCAECQPAMSNAKMVLLPASSPGFRHDEVSAVRKSQPKHSLAPSFPSIGPCEVILGDYSSCCLSLVQQFLGIRLSWQGPNSESTVHRNSPARQEDVFIAGAQWSRNCRLVVEPLPGVLLKLSSLGVFQPCEALEAGTKSNRPGLAHFRIVIPVDSQVLGRLSLVVNGIINLITP